MMPDDLKIFYPIPQSNERERELFCAGVVHADLYNGYDNVMVCADVISLELSKLLNSPLKQIISYYTVKKPANLI